MSMEKLTIMLAEDDPFARSMLEVILSEEGYHVKIAENGREALRIFYEEHDIDLIVTDMNMPEMNGLELIRELRDEKNDVPIIVLTSNREIKTAVNAIYSGANAYLLKDENIEDTFVYSIRQTWQHYMLQKEKQQLLKDLEQKNKELERLSFLDGLTGISNRRYFDMVIDQEWRRVVRENAPISIAMIDIDYFKLFNDAYGHLIGDECLRDVASALEKSLFRPGDFIARYGGEEFVAVLPSVGLQGGLEVARRIQYNVEEMAIPHVDSKVSRIVTISIGLACCVPGQDSKPADLIKSSDEALYSAKASGRNRIHIYKDGKGVQI